LPQLAAPAEVALGELHHLVLALQARDVAFDARHGPAPYAINRRLRRRSSACETSVALRRCRFRLGCFLVRMWLLYAWCRRKRPVPVSRTRLRRARFDFCFGIPSSPGLAPGVSCHFGA